VTYTGRGDKGRTDLYSGERVSKASETIRACGTVDELESLIGVCQAHCDKDLSELQNELHILTAELADRNPDKRITEENTERVEELCDHYQQEIPPLRNFVLSGGCVAASHLDHARSVARRMERRVVEMEPESEEVLAYVNRVSDLLFLMARHENHVEGVDEDNPDY